MGTYKYYDIHKLLALGDSDKDIKYFISYGERSAGKSYSTCKYVLENYVKNRKQSGICRRWNDDWDRNVAGTYFDGLVSNNEVRRITNGQWSQVYYYGHKWYLANYDEEKCKLIKDDQPFAYAFALNTWEKTKASQFPDMNILVLEEFISRNYIGSENTEFQLFLNLVSTIARERADFKVVLLGNSIAKYGNPYFICMGIEQRVMRMEPGQTVVFSNDANRLKIAVEFTPSKGADGSGKESDILFDFTDNAAARQITSGDWQLEYAYPSLPTGTRIKPMDIQFSYFLLYRDKCLQADIVLQDNKFYTYFHRKTTELKDTENDLIFDLEYHLEHNYRRDILKPIDPITQKIASFFKSDQVYCQDAEVGEILYSYINSL